MRMAVNFRFTGPRSLPTSRTNGAPQKMLTVVLGVASRTKHLFVSTYPGADIWQARPQRRRRGGELLASSKKRALRGAAYIMGPTGASKHPRYGNTNSAS